MWISIVIPTCNRNDLLARCLDRLAPGAQTLDSAHYEVIVTDDGSAATAEPLVRDHYPWARWTAGPRRGPAANRNHGARLAGARWIAFLDDDCIPDRGWLGGYRQASADHPDRAVFEGRVYVDRPRRTLGEVSPVNETGGHLWSCNFVIDRELFARLGGFNEAFPYACLEDVDLRLRLTKRGEEIVFVREAAVCHPWRPSKGWQAIRQYQQSVEVFLREHPEMAHRINRGYYLKRALMNLRDLSRFGLFNPLEIQAVIPDFVGNLQMCLRPVRRSSG